MLFDGIYGRVREFGYANARLRAERTKLLDKDTLKSLCEVESTDAMLEILGGTVYGQHVDAWRARHRGVILISKAVMERFTRKVAQIEEMLSPRKRSLLYAATGRFDVYNLKLLFLEIIKGKDCTGMYIEAGAVSGRRLALMRNVRDIGLLKRVTREIGYDIGADSDKYENIVQDVERSYYERLRALKSECADEPETQRYIEKVIDYRNFDLAIRAVRGMISPERAEPMGGGLVPTDAIKKGMKLGVEEVVELFGIREEYGKCEGSLSWLEEMYDRKLLKWVVRSGSANPFSVIGIVGFVRLLDIEARNVRSIAVAKSVFGPDEIKGKIIW